MRHYFYLTGTKFILALCITDYDIDVELAHPTDIFWNSNAICEKLKDEDMSLKIAYAIKTVYSEKDYSKDVL